MILVNRRTIFRIYRAVWAVIWVQSVKEQDGVLNTSFPASYVLSKESGQETQITKKRDLEILKEERVSQLAKRKLRQAN